MSCKHLIRRDLQPGRLGTGSFRTVRSHCALKGAEGSARDQMNEAHAAQGFADGTPEECPFARAGEYPKCRWFEK